MVLCARATYSKKLIFLKRERGCAPRCCLHPGPPTPPPWPGQGSETQDPPSRPHPPTLGTSPRLRGAALALAHLWLQTPPPVSCPPCEPAREVRSRRPGGGGTREVCDASTGPSWDDPERAPRGPNGRQTPRPRPPPPARNPRPPRSPRPSPGGKPWSRNGGPRALQPSSPSGGVGRCGTCEKADPARSSSPALAKPPLPGRPARRDPRPRCFGTPSVRALTPRGAELPSPPRRAQMVRPGSRGPGRASALRSPGGLRQLDLRASWAPRSARAEQLGGRLAVRPTKAKKQKQNTWLYLA